MTKYPAWYNQGDESIKKKANRKEATVFKHLVSGALSYKGDFSTKDCVLDNKSTDKHSIRVTEDMCDKLCKDAIVMNKEKSILILDMPKYYIVCHVQRKESM